MPKLIIGNVDNEHMLGDRSVVTAEFRQSTAIVANRMVWLAEEGDIIILPGPVTEKFLNYVCRFKQIDRRSLTIVSPALHGDEPVLLDFQTVSDPQFLSRVQQAMQGRRDWWLLPYYYDRTMGWLERKLGLIETSSYNEFLRQGGAEILNSKTEFRRLASSLKLPIARGQSCSSARNLGHVIADLLPDTGMVILKQDYNAGGEGNIIVTRHNGVTEAPGAGKIIPIRGLEGLHEVAEELWLRLTRQRNINLIAEVYHPADHIYFSDYQVTPGGQTRYLLHGEMRMEPLWVGFRIPGPLPAARSAHLMTGSALLTKAVADMGYVGMINYDAVFTADGSPVFLEFNGRCGGTTHIHEVAHHLVGSDYMDRYVLLTRNKIKASAFDFLVSALEAHGLHYNDQTRQGLIFMTEDTTRMGTVEYVVMAHNTAQAHEIENAALNLIAAHMRRAA